MDKFKEVLEGKVKKEDLTPEELVGYQKFVSDLSKEEEAKVTGLRGARQAEERKLADAKAEVERIERENRDKAGNRGGTPPEHPQMKQFRDEQVLKAKNRLWGTIQVSDSEKAVIEDKFARLDSGKVDADLIYEDLLSAVAAANPKKFIDLSQDEARRVREAAEELGRQAGGAGGSGGGEGEKGKFGDDVLRFAKEAGITPEAALKQMTQGNKRTY